MQEEANIEQGEQPEIPKGFMTKEEWTAKGRDEADWRDPEEWKKRGDTILPIVKKERDDLRGVVTELKGDIERIHAFNQKQEERVRNEERKRIEEKYELKRKEAFEENDYEGIRKADEDKAKELKKVEAEPEPSQQGEDVVFNEWKNKNPWYTEDTDLQDYANNEGAALRDAKMARGMSRKEALDAVATEIKALFPDKFVNKNRDLPPSVETDANNITVSHDGK